MIAVDSNILIQSVQEESRLHHRAALAIRTLGEGEDPWGLPWPCLNEFLSIATNRRIWNVPCPLEQAVGFVEAWLASPAAVPLSEGPGFLEVWRELMLSSGVTGGQVHDTRIAAICLYHGVSELWTADRDFALFPRLKTRNPLVA